MLLPVRADDPNRCQKQYYRRRREERCAYQRAYGDRKRGGPARLKGAWRFVGSGDENGEAEQDIRLVVAASEMPRRRQPASADQPMT